MNTIEAVVNVIAQKITLSAEEKTLIADQLQERSLKKGALFLKLGSRTQEMCFVANGLLRTFYWDAEGNEITTGFAQNGHFCTDLKSFQEGSASERTIEALVDSKIIILSRTAIDIFRAKISNWLLFEREYIADVFIKKTSFLGKITTMDAKDAYQLFVEQYQQAALFAPQHQIASFLGMSPFTLSRVKK